MALTIGVLALQGSYIEHLNHLKCIKSVECILIKYPHELEALDGIILPGGESTALIKLLHVSGLFYPLQKKIQQGLPVWGTCAGLILLAKNVDGCPSQGLATMSIHVKRNAYGSQIDSFSDSLLVPSICEFPLSLIFIRAPLITSVEESAQILVSFKGQIIGAIEDHMIGTTFHPELTQSHDFYHYFIKHVTLWNLRQNSNCESFQTVHQNL